MSSSAWSKASCVIARSTASVAVEMTRPGSTRSPPSMSWWARSSTSTSGRTAIASPTAACRRIRARAPSWAYNASRISACWKWRTGHGRADLGGEPGRHRGGQSAVDVVGGQPGHGLEQTELAVPPDHGGHVEQPPGLDRQPAQPVGQDVVDRPGDVVPREVRVGGVADQPRQLLEEERVAAGAGGGTGGQRLVRLPAEAYGEQVARRLVGQAGQPQALGRGRPRQPGQHRPERARRLGVLHAVGAQQHQRGVAGPFGHRRQERQARLVRPVQVLQDDEQVPGRRGPRRRGGRPPRRAAPPA